MRSPYVVASEENALGCRMTLATSSGLLRARNILWAVVLLIRNFFSLCHLRKVLQCWPYRSAAASLQVFPKPEAGSCMMHGRSYSKRKQLRHSAYSCPHCRSDSCTGRFQLSEAAPSASNQSRRRVCPVGKGILLKVLCRPLPGPRTHACCRTGGVLFAVSTAESIGRGRRPT